MFYFKIAQNSFWQILSRFLSTGTVLLATYLITNNLSRDLWGEFVTVTSYIAIFSLLADFGLNGYVVKNLIISEDKIERYFENLLGLRLILSLVSIFLALAILVFLPHSSTIKFGIIVGTLMILAQSLFTTAQVVFQEKLKYDFFVVSDVLGSLVTLFLVFLAVQVSSPLAVIILIFVVGSFVKAVLGLGLAWFLVRHKGFAFNLSTWKVIFWGSLPLGVMLFLSQVNANIDKQIIALSDFQKISNLSSEVAVGIYGLAYRFFDFAIALPAFVANSSYPILLNKYKSDRADLFKFSKQLLLWLVIIGSILAIFGWLLAPTAVSIFGDYSESILPLRILLLGLPIFFVTSLLLWLAVTVGKEVYLPFIYGFATLANIVLNLIFIPRYGYNAAAWVTLGSEIIIFGLLSFILLRLEK